MRCPYCGKVEDRVVDSRTADDGHVIRRRRECRSCGRRFTTYERREEVPMLVVKKDGTREPFSREKIIKGIMTACEKRPVSHGDIVALVEKIERDLGATYEGEIPSRAIGERVMAALKELDEVAYIRFASVYRSFRDVGEFMDELHKLMTPEEETDDSASPASRKASKVKDA
jgi:transcriptional repressor NrdR